MSASLHPRSNRAAALDFNFLRRKMADLVGSESVSVEIPHSDTADNSRRNSQREEPPGFRQPDNAHGEQADRNEQSNRMTSPISSAVISERNDFCGRWQIARIFLECNLMDSQGDNSLRNLGTL